MFATETKGPSRAKPAQAAFKVQPRMTKWEVKEYLTKIYKVPVKKVGRRKLGTIGVDGGGQAPNSRLISTNGGLLNLGGCLVLLLLLFSTGIICCFA